MGKKNFMRINGIVFVILIVTSYCNTGECYVERYPPYRFKDGQPRHLGLEPLVSMGGDKTEYKTNDGKIIVRLEETSDSLSLFVQDEGKVIAEMSEKVPPIPYAVYRYDLDLNGLNDYLIFYNYRGCGLGVLNDKVEIYLKQDNHSYQKISYDTISSGLEDFVDVNKDGKYEVIITGFYWGTKHNYFTYNIYEIFNGKLVNADIKFKGFPKFIWFTHKSNDKDTKHLTPEERAGHMDKKDNSVNYEIIK